MLANTCEIAVTLSSALAGVSVSVHRRRRVAQCRTAWIEPDIRHVGPRRGLLSRRFKSALRGGP